jgi:hypothetical protein
MNKAATKEREVNEPSKSWLKSFVKKHKDKILQQMMKRKQRKGLENGQDT